MTHLGRPVEVCHRPTSRPPRIRKCAKQFHSLSICLFTDRSARTGKHYAQCAVYSHGIVTDIIITIAQRSLYNFARFFDKCRKIWCSKNRLPLFVRQISLLAIVPDLNIPGRVFTSARCFNSCSSSSRAFLSTSISSKIRVRISSSVSLPASKCLFSFVSSESEIEEDPGVV